MLYHQKCQTLRRSYPNSTNWYGQLLTDSTRTHPKTVDTLAYPWVFIPSHTAPLEKAQQKCADYAKHIGYAHVFISTPPAPTWQASCILWEKWRSFTKTIRGVAIPVSDGATERDLPWDDINTILVTGSYAWQSHDDCRRIVAAAHDRNKLVHLHGITSSNRLLDILQWHETPPHSFTCPLSCRLPLYDLMPTWQYYHNNKTLF